MVNLVEATRWAPLIGRLFIAFGNIEETTHLSIRDWAGAQIHRHFITVDGAVCAHKRFKLPDIEQDAVVIDGVFGLPMEGCFVSFRFLTEQQAGPGYIQTFRDGDDHICAIVRFIAGVIFARKIDFSAIGLAGDVDPRISL